MNKLEKIFVVGGIVIGLSLVGFGLYRDNKFPEYKDYIKNTIIKGAGLVSFVTGCGLGLGRMLEEEDKRYLKGKKKIYPL